MNPNTSYVVASVDNGTDPQKGGGGWESVSRSTHSILRTRDC